MQDRLILLTNDDGLWAPGLEALARVASGFGRVVTVAPDRNRSAVSSSLSLHDILRLRDMGSDRHACDGTPVDCVLIGIRSGLLERTPDWVLSGVNHGYNLGEDVFYSGTVAAALEGSLNGARSAAFSLDPEGSLPVAEPWIHQFLERWEGMELPHGRIWNLNFPKEAPKGFKLTSQDHRNYHDKVEQRWDPRGTPYYWIGGAVPTFERNRGSDAEATQDGWISTTPLRLDLSCPELLARRETFRHTFGGD
jgi:5'-nucleotidase